MYMETEERKEDRMKELNWNGAILIVLSSSNSIKNLRKDPCFLTIFYRVWIIRRDNEQDEGERGRERKWMMSQKVVCTPMMRAIMKKMMMIAK